MNKLIILGLVATVGAANLALAPQGTSVQLQASSPGTEQTGHLNISGTATVGLLKSQGTVFGQSTAPTGFAYGGFFAAASNQARGFYGFASSPTGLTYGGFSQNASEFGTSSLRNWQPQQPVLTKWRLFPERKLRGAWLARGRCFANRNDLRRLWHGRQRRRIRLV